MLMRAEVYIEDDTGEDGGITIKFRFIDGFNPNSMAHQACNIIKRHLDSVFAFQPESVEIDDKPPDPPLALLN